MKAFKEGGSMEGDEVTVLWRLYDSNAQLFFNNLNLIQLLKIVDSVPHSEIQYWHVCRDSDVEWYPLEQRLTAIKNLAKEELNKKPPGIMSLNSFVSHQMVDTKSSFTNTKLKLDTKIEKRQIKRLKKHVDVFIDVGEEILFAETKDISVVSIKLSKKFPIKYKGKYYPITIKGKPSITLRCKPHVSDKEMTRGTWNIVLLDPNFNLSALGDFLNS
jgi:hypothetical protein